MRAGREKMQTISYLSGTDETFAETELPEKASQKDTTISAVSFVRLSFGKRNVRSGTACECHDLSVR